MEVTANHVAKAAQRILGLLIAKDKAHGGMPADIFSKLYDALVQSVINYGTAIWGQKSYSSINKVQNRATKYFLGLHKKASNAMANGDMGWDAPLTRQWLKVGQHWARLVNMNKNRLAYKVFRWSYNLAIRNNKNWVYRTIKQLQNLGITHSIKQQIDIGNIINTMKVGMHQQNEEEWRNELNRNHAQGVLL